MGGRCQTYSGVQISASKQRNPFKIIALENLADSHMFPLIFQRGTSTGPFFPEGDLAVLTLLFLPSRLTVAHHALFSMHAHATEEFPGPTLFFPASATL